MWNDDARLLLIDEVKKRYEKCKSIKERCILSERKKEMFAEITEVINATHLTEMQYTEDDVRTQWKNLKDTFKRKLKRKLADLEAGNDDTEPTWRFWSKMLFIKDDFGPDRNRSPHTNGVASLDILPNSLESFLHSLVDKQYDENGMSAPTPTKSGSFPGSSIATNQQSAYKLDVAVSQGGPSPMISNDSPTVFTHPVLCFENSHGFAAETQKTTTRHHSDKDSRIPDSESPNAQTSLAATRSQRKTTKRKCTDEAGDPFTFEDEHTWFGRSVTSVLRRLSESSPMIGLILKKQISDLMYEAEISHLRAAKSGTL